MIRDNDAKAIKSIRSILKLKQQSTPKINTCRHFLWWLCVISILTAIIITKSCEAPARAYSVNNAYTTDNVIKSIIGEAEGEGYPGMLAIALAIRNRGTLHGVYGLHAPRVIKHLYSEHTYLLATKAWKNSEYSVDITNGATGWGNVEDINIFKTHTWFSRYRITAKIGHHWFYGM